jgi:hypothetical protein
MSDEKTILLYALSTLAQTCAELAARITPEIKNALAERGRIERAALFN